MTRQELTHSEEYWEYGLQMALFDAVVKYGEDNDLDGDGLKKHLALNSRKFNQLIQGEFNGSLEDIVRICVAIGYAPKFELVPLSEI